MHMYAINLTPRSRVLLLELIVAQLVKKHPSLLWNQKAHYRVHNSPPLYAILSQTNPVHALTNCVLISILIFSSHL